MKLVIVSGLSGAGKTVALHSLEDMGAYCIDNLPASLLPAIAGQLENWQSAYPCVAVSIDARNISLGEVAGLLQTLKDSGVAYEILFLEASDEALIKRFSETRRKHPLTHSAGSGQAHSAGSGQAHSAGAGQSFQNVPLAEAIQRERQLLEPLSSRADLHVDTTQLHLHQLRDLIRLRLKLQPSQGLSLLFESFGFKYGIPADADFVFDARCLPNPHWDLRLRPLTGKDEPVIAFLCAQPTARRMLDDLIGFLGNWLPQFEADNRSYLTVAVGCTGGRHRSVYLAEQLAAHFRQQREGVLLRHRELL